MKRYGAYGLTLACEGHLPFVAAEAGVLADVTVVAALRQPPTAPVARLYRELNRDGQGWSLRYRDPAGGWLHFDYAAAAASLRVTGSVCWEEAVPVLAGVACAVLLASGGKTLLHGAALMIGGRAIAILGASGHGKSTLAAALAKTGARLLSEDLVVLSEDEERFQVEPGYSWVSLLPDSLAAIEMDTARTATPDPRRGTEKYWLDTHSLADGAAETGPLAAIYILDAPDSGRSSSEAAQLPRAAATLALIQHLYGAAWIRTPNRDDLAFCARVASRVTVFSLARPRSLSAVAGTASMMREHLSATNERLRAPYPAAADAPSPPRPTAAPRAASVPPPRAYSRG